MANIHDVAKRAGVSKSTVSLVLNHSPLVKEDTRELVEAAIEELGYVPSSNARGLRNQKTNSLGIVILTEEEGGTGYDIDQFAGLCSYNIADGIYQGLAGSRYSVATEYISLKKATHSLPKVVEDRRVDGVFVVGSFFDVDIIPRIQACGILLEKGHRSICYLNCPRIFHSSKDRTKGAQKAFEEYAHQLEKSWILYTNRNNGLSGYETFARFWESGERPDAIFAANAPLALGAMQYMREKGIRVPQDISVLVYEDSVLCGYHVPSLSAVNIRKEKMGCRAAVQMLCLLGNTELESDCETLTPYIVERGSVLQR